MTRDGETVEHRSETDSLGMNRQLGAMPVPGSLKGLIASIRIP